MKNVNQIKFGIKANGLTGEDFRRKLQSQCLGFGRELIQDMVVETEIAEPDFNQLLIFLAHFTEIFITAEMYRFDSGFAESVQSVVFAMTDDHNTNICKWRDKLFGGKPQPESEVETGATSPTDGDLKSLAEQLSDLLHNPLLPRRLKGVIDDELLEFPDMHTPEIILLNLEKLNGQK